MMVRLAFATALRADADTLLLDEVMAVGDAQFQRKCIDVFHGLKRQRKTIVLVSHDLHAVQRFCDHVYWLDKGHLVMGGEAAEVVQHYLGVSQHVDLDAPTVEHDDDPRWGDGTMRFTEVNLTDDEGRPVNQVPPWTSLVLRTTIVATAPVDEAIFGFVIWLGGDPGLLGQLLPARDGRRPLRTRHAHEARHPVHRRPGQRPLSGDGGRVVQA